MTVQKKEQLSEVEASLNYLRPTTTKPVNYTFQPPPGVPRQSGEPDWRTVRIRNARPMASQLSLDAEGFVFLQAPAPALNAGDHERVKTVYYPHVEQLIRQVTGAETVIAFDYNIRNGQKAEAGAAGVREPVKRVHNDFTARSGLERAGAELVARGEDAAQLTTKRFAMINLWRPIGQPVKESPIALCDARTLAPEDFVVTDLVYRDRTGEVYSVLFSPRHHWSYFPDMAPDEVLLIKCFDSAEDGRARFTAHTAFDDPTSPVGAPPRESIEVRTLAIFPCANGATHP